MRITHSITQFVYTAFAIVIFLVNSSEVLESVLGTISSFTHLVSKQLETLSYHTYVTSSRVNRLLPHPSPAYFSLKEIIGLVNTASLQSVTRDLLFLPAQVYPELVDSSGYLYRRVPGWKQFIVWDAKNPLFYGLPRELFLTAAEANIQWLFTPKAKGSVTIYVGEPNYDFIKAVTEKARCILYQRAQREATNYQHFDQVNFACYPKDLRMLKYS